MKSDDSAGRERWLHRRVMAGDQDAWRIWYDQTYSDLQRYVHWRCAGLPGLADEVLQETWLTAVRRIRRFDPRRGVFLAWLRGIAANVVANRLRRQKAATRRFQPLAAAPADSTSPEAEEARRCRAGRVAMALASLPEHYEAVLRAKYVDNASVKAIAAATGRSAKAVESLLSHARESFRDRYQTLVARDGETEHSSGGSIGNRELERRET